MPDDSQLPAILIVDDSPTVRAIIHRALGKLGSISFEESPDGLDAIRRLSQKKFALAVLDINMPLLDGLKVLAHARTSELNAKVPVIMVTTEGGSAEQQKALELGATAYLTKPIDNALLVETARLLLKKDGRHPKQESL
ncbi:MAG: response regulator [Bdellovibrionota bacterium]